MTDSFHDPFESRVASAFPRTPNSLASQAIDTRLRALTASTRTIRRDPASRLRPARRSAVALAFALLVLVAAGGGLLSLYRGIVEVNPAFRLGWDRATLLGISQSDSGYRVTLDRAYADINSVMVAMSVTDAQGRAANGAVRGYAALTDDQDGQYEMTLAASEPNGASSAANVIWFRARPPLVAGSRSFHLVLPSVGVPDSDLASQSPESAGIAGPFAFTFSLAVQGGTSVVVDASTSGSGTVTFVGPSVTGLRVGDRVDGVSVHVDHISATDATIRATVTMTVRAPRGTGWAPIGRFIHAGSTFEVATVSTGATGGTMDFETVDSTSARSGRWELRIDEIVSETATDGSGQIRVAGPWVVSFSLP